jgi:pre-mRNA-splicing factor 38A
MANLTDPLITAIQGTDPQNLMEYITRQKIYDCRFWKEECFGLTAVDVLERAAKSLKCIGGTFGGNMQPTKFLCLTLKLLQLQPEDELIQEFITQDHFKYVRALGAFYLRLTGRPPDIYESLEPLFSDFSKLKFRGVTEWTLVYMDEFVHELLSTVRSCGIALPRLPFRETLQEVGYLEEGPRPTALREVIQDAGGLEEYLKYKMEQHKSPAAIALWEKRMKKKGQKTFKTKSVTAIASHETGQRNIQSTQGESREQGEIEEGYEHQSPDDNHHRMEDREDRSRDRNPPLEDCKEKKRKPGDSRESKRSKKPKYGTLFKDKRKEKDRTSKSTNETSLRPQQQPPQEGSDEYWNEQRAKLGLKPLKK